MFQYQNVDRVKIRRDLPQPAVVAEPQIFVDEQSLAIRYYTTDENVALLRFPTCHYLIFGDPNDEARGGHRLAKRGIRHYAVHEIENSLLIQQLEQQNSIHPRHDPVEFLKDKKHYIFTFQDSTLECVIHESEQRMILVKIVSSDEEADELWPLREDA